MSRTAGGDMLFDPEAKGALAREIGGWGGALVNFAGVEIP